VLRDAERALGEGLCVLNFPEGTTSAGDRVRPFHRGLFGLAARAGIPVVPVALAYASADLAWTGDATFLPSYLRLAAAGATRVRVRFGTPLLPGRPAAVLAAEAREAVAALLGVVGRAAAVGA
jgi:1-acyl-sn-glycerol-3-phosphate acyltransferase